MASLAGCADEEPSVGSFCDELRQAPSLAAVVTGFADQDPSRLTAALDDTAEAYADVRAAAPDDIAPDVDRTVDLVDAVIDAIRRHGDDPVAAAAAVREVVAAMPDAGTSSLAVADYARAECQLELNPAVPDDDQAPPTSDDGSVTGGM